MHGFPSRPPPPPSFTIVRRFLELVRLCKRNSPCYHSICWKMHSGTVVPQGADKRVEQGEELVWRLKWSVLISCQMHLATKINNETLCVFTQPFPRLNFRAIVVPLRRIWIVCERKELNSTEDACKQLEKTFFLILSTSSKFQESNKSHKTKVLCYNK